MVARLKQNTIGPEKTSAQVKPLNPKMLDKCDRQLLKSLKSLEFAAMKKELSACWNDGEIKAILQRRDFIVETFDNVGAQKL